MIILIQYHVGYDRDEPERLWEERRPRKARRDFLAEVISKRKQEGPLGGATSEEGPSR